MALPLLAVAGTAAIAGTAAGMYSGNKAASAQRAAAGAAEARIQAAKNEALGYINPYAQAGQSALSPLTALLTGREYNPATGQFTDLNQQQRMENFLESPGYQFRLSQGLSALQKSQVARGGLLSGGALKEITDYSQGAASDEYNNYLNQLFQMSGMGFNAATGQANAALGAGSSMANMAFQGGMANANKYSNLSNFGYGIAGMGASAAMGGMSPSSAGAATGGGGGGTYNPSPFMSAAGGVG